MQANVVDTQIISHVSEDEIGPDLQHREMRGHHHYDTEVPAVRREDELNDGWK